MGEISEQPDRQSRQDVDILIVDDMPEDMKLLSHILVRAGYGVRTARGGELCLAAVDLKTPDLILLDVRMPKMDGFEVCRRLKSREVTRDVPIIFISALQDASNKVLGFDAGGLDFITKPFDQTEVLARVRTHLELHAMHQQLEIKVQQRTADLQKSNRALKMISLSNKILVRATDELSLLERICETVVDVGGFPFCWVGYPQPDNDKGLAMAAFAAADDSTGHPMAKALAAGNADDQGHFPLEAVQGAGSVVIRHISAHNGAENPCGRAALQSGLACCASLPLVFDSRIYGVLSVYSDHSNKFDETEVDLLNELGEDLAFGIHTLRERAEHQKAQKDLAESEQRYRQLFEKAGDAVFLLKAQGPDIGCIIQANQAAAKMHGYTVRELIGMPVRNLDTPEAVETFPERIKRLQSGEWIHEEIHHIKKDGTPFATEVSAGVIDSGDRQYILAFYRDISDRKRIEAENAALESQIRQANKMEAIGTLASGIAHDFNNILSAASGYTELSIPLVQPGSILSSNLQKIQQANKRAAELVRHILTLSREKEAAAQVLQPKLIIKEAIKLLRASLPATIEIQRQIDSNAYIMGDATQVHQIIMNLCVNASHAMEETGGVLSIALTDVELDTAFARQYVHLSPGPYVVLSVSDTGQGIPDEIIDKIFDPYFTTKPQGKGTGLGLAVVNGIVNSYRGAITAESEVGKGARFTLFFPAVAAEQGSQAETGLPIPRGSERILFIDDEPTLVEIGQQILQLLGYQVTTQTGSSQALELYRQDPAAFDMLITDYTMPKMTGIQLARSVLEINPDLPIILLSGLETGNLEAEARHTGIGGFLCKPIDIQEIAVMVRQLLDR